MRSIKELVEKHSNLIEIGLENRLYNKGTYADGKKIKTYKAEGSNVYSSFTANLKAQEGQPTDRVTLKDSGEFYETFEVKPDQDSFSIEYNDSKSEGQISDNIPELEEAIKAGEETIKDLIDNIKTDIRNDFKQEAKEAILYGLR